MYIEEKRKPYNISHDRANGAKLKERIMIPFDMEGVQVKIIFVPQQDYYLVVLSDYKLEIYMVEKDGIDEHKGWTIILSRTFDCKLVNWRLSASNPNIIVVLKEDEVFTINLSELKRSEESAIIDICKMRSRILEESEVIKNFVISSKSELMIQTNQAMKVYDLVTNEIVFQANFDFNKVN